MFKTMTALQKFAVTFIASAGSAMTVMNSPNFMSALPIVLLLWLALIMVVWVNRRQGELQAVAANAVAAERLCQEELHARDKLLAVLWEKLRQRSGGTRAPVPDLKRIVGDKVARAIEDAGALVDLNQDTQEIKIR